MWNRILLIFAGLVGLLLLFSITLNLLPSFKVKKLEGDKSFVIQQILRKSYDCFQKNYPRKESVICDRLTFSSREAIKSSDILESLDTSKLSKASLKAEDLGTNGEIIIRYENGIIYIEKL